MQVKNFSPPPSPTESLVSSPTSTSSSLSSSPTLDTSFYSPLGSPSSPINNIFSSDDENNALTNLSVTVSSNNSNRTNGDGDNSSIERNLNPLRNSSFSSNNGTTTTMEDAVTTTVTEAAREQGQR